MIRFSVSGQAASVACCAAAILLASCRGSSEPGDQLASYRLAAVNGESLPAAIIRDVGTSVEVVSGTLTLSPDGSFRQVFTVRDVTAAGVSSAREAMLAGRFRRDGGVLTMILPDGGLFPGSVNAQRLEYLSEGANTYVFERSPE